MAADHVQAPAGTTAGERLPPGRGGTRFVWEYHLLIWRRFAVSSVLTSVGTPLLFLLALGVGLGHLVAGGAPSTALGGVSYLAYIAPALLASAALQTAVNECSFPVYAGFVWTRMWWSATTAPLTPAQVVRGIVAYLTTRLAVGAAVYYLVLLLFSAAGGPAGPLMIVAAVLTGLSAGSWLIALGARLTREGVAYNLVNRLVLVPLQLFSGTFFPVASLPAILRPLAWVSPLWHGNELARAAARGTFAPIDLAHLAVLLLLTGAGVLMARRTFHARLVA